MDENEMKQACLLLSKAALELYDIVETKGLTAPIDDISNVLTLKSIVDESEKIRRYYFRRTTQRMLALGVSPVDLINTINGKDG